MSESSSGSEEANPRIDGLWQLKSGVFNLVDYQTNGDSRRKFTIYQKARKPTQARITREGNLLSNDLRD
jgi:hypothetical protein